jgi:hypothetical protein
VGLHYQKEGAPTLPLLSQRTIPGFWYVRARLDSGETVAVRGPYRHEKVAETKLVQVPIGTPVADSQLKVLFDTPPTLESQEAHWRKRIADVLLDRWSLDPSIALMEGIPYERMAQEAADLAAKLFVHD